MNQSEESVTEASQPGAEPIPEDREIIARCQTGDKQAFGLLVQRYMRRAYFCALALVKTHEAALDLSQEAFVRAFKAINQFDNSRRFFTWYYRMLRNLCLNSLRDQSRRARSFSDFGEEMLEIIPDSQLNAAQEYESKEIQAAVWQALNALKPHEKEIIVLKDFQGYSYKAIAELLDCPIGTVMSRLYTARTALREKLREYFDES